MVPLIYKSAVNWLRVIKCQAIKVYGEWRYSIRKLGTRKWQPLYRYDEGKSGILKVSEKGSAIVGN